MPVAICETNPTGAGASSSKSQILNPKEGVDGGAAGFGPGSNVDRPGARSDKSWERGETLGRAVHNVWAGELRFHAPRRARCQVITANLDSTAGPAFCAEVEFVPLMLTEYGEQANVQNEIEPVSNKGSA
jgi:hypothetical protein